MIKQANINFLMSSSFCSDHNAAIAESCLIRGSSYRRFVYCAVARTAYTTEGLNILARDLISIACRAHAAREIAAVGQISELMLSLPIPEQMKAVARYYQGQCFYRRGEFDRAQQILEPLVEEVAPEYKGRALLTIGATYADSTQADNRTELFLEALKAAKEYDPLTTIEAHWNLAIEQGLRGDHKRAVASLENLFPLVQAVTRSFPEFYSYLNSYAVELGEVGRLDEANAALSVALATPFATAYPRWAETRDELETRRRHPRPSFVALSIPKKPKGPKPQQKKLRPAKWKRVRVTLIVRALHWLAGLSIFRSVSFARVLIKPISADPEALLSISSDWPISGPGPRAPPSIH